MSWLWTIIIGLVAGALAKFIMPGRDPGGIIVTILLGLLVRSWPLSWVRLWDGIPQVVPPD